MFMSPYLVLEMTLTLWCPSLRSSTVVQFISKPSNLYFLILQIKFHYTSPSPLLSTPKSLLLTFFSNFSIAEQFKICAPLLFAGQDYNYFCWILHPSHDSFWSWGHSMKRILMPVSRSLARFGIEGSLGGCSTVVGGRSGPRWGSRGHTMQYLLAPWVKCLGFIPNLLGSHWRVLSKE